MMRNSYNENVQVGKNFSIGFFSCGIDDIMIKQGLSQLKGAEGYLKDSTF